MVEYSKGIKEEVVVNEETELSYFWMDNTIFSIFM